MLDVFSSCAFGSRSCKTLRRASAQQGRKALHSKGLRCDAREGHLMGCCKFTRSAVSCKKRRSRTTSTVFAKTSLSTMMSRPQSWPCRLEDSMDFPVIALQEGFCSAIRKRSQHCSDQTVAKVMDTQRKIVYGLRRRALLDDDETIRLVASISTRSAFALIVRCLLSALTFTDCCDAMCSDKQKHRVCRQAGVNFRRANSATALRASASLCIISVRIYGLTHA